MNQAVITLIILAIMVVLFVTEKLPLGLVSMVGAILLGCLGIIGKSDVFAAFSGSTIVLLGAMMLPIFCAHQWHRHSIFHRHT